MAQKRYELTTQGAEYAQGGTYRFRIAHKVVSGGTTRIRTQKNCPILAMSVSDVMGTSDDIAQAMIEGMKAPTKTKRNGVTKVPVGSMMFDDVTESTTSEDVTYDLDSILV